MVETSRMIVPNVENVVKAYAIKWLVYDGFVRSEMEPC